MERRANAIKLHLKMIGISKSLIEEAVIIGLECSEKVSKISKISAAVGLLIASRKRGIPYSVGEIAEMLRMDRKKIFHAFSKMHLNYPSTTIKSQKCNYLDKLLNEHPDDNSLRGKAYAHLIDTDGDTPRLAACLAYNKALEDCGYKVAFKELPKKKPKNLDNLLAQQQELLLDAKQNNSMISKQYSVRLLSLITGNSIPAASSLPHLSILDLEKEELNEALGICLSKYVSTI